MTKNFSVLIAVVAFLATVSAECPNACSAHGKCGAYDMCTCFRNWMSNDCSERICQFGLAHVDTPKGDLDASSGALTGPDVVVAVNSAMYPYGTTEQYPSVTDIDGNVLKNTAHEYRECSNKGICDRTTGNCACFEGYEGSACQRASCPTGANGVCSGHGTCQSISEIAEHDYGNVYKLWDEDATMGCVCDGGYEGPDCSQRKCKYCVDPLYKDNDAVIRYSNFTYNFYLENSGNNIYGNYSLVFYDSFGEDWQTQPIPWNADCATVTAALEGLPNKVIPENTVRCQQRSAFSVAPISLHYKNGYTLAFPENPGKLKQIEINKFLDGSRPTLFSDEATSTLGWHIYSDGFIGEDYDMVPDRCEGVELTLTHTGTTAGMLIQGLDANEIKLLKRCLGDSNGVESDNTEVYNWDYGDAVQNSYFTNPHLVKLQDATQYKAIKRSDIQGGDADYDPILQQIPVSLLCDNSPFGDPKRFGSAGGNGYCSNRNAPGFYAVLFFDHTTSEFRILAHPSLLVVYSSSTPFYIYTTTGHLQLVSSYAQAYTARSDYTNSLKAERYFTNILKTTNTSNVATQKSYFGDLSCENNGKQNGALDCLNKNDYVMVIRGENTFATQQKNVAFPNIYQIKKVGITNKPENPEYGTNPAERQEIVLDYTLNTRYVFDNTANYGGQIYKFYPPKNNGYHYAGPCSNRGICNQETGTCECFHGYSDDNCGCINALAV